MIPILYEANDTTFTSNGIGRLGDAISCTVTEERNGVYELEMEYPIDGLLYKELTEDRIIFAKPSDGGNNQAFRIYKISRPINGVVTVSAEHISYLLTKAVVMPFTATSCLNAFEKIVEKIVGVDIFNFSTNKTENGTLVVEVPTQVKRVLGGEQNSILDVYGGGEYEFDNFDVILHDARGEEKPITLRYGINLTDLERTTDITNVYNGIVPFWKGTVEQQTVIVTLSEKVLMAEGHESDYAYPIIKEVDLSNEFEERPSQGSLRTRAKKYITDNEGWKLTENIKVSFVKLSETVEYKDYSALEQINLCDTIDILYTKLGVNAKAKVVKTVWDVLHDRYKELELGDAVNSFIDTLISNNNKIEYGASDYVTKPYLEAYIEGLDGSENPY